jgi:hypothetical protein
MPVERRVSDPMPDNAGVGRSKPRPLHLLLTLAGLAAETTFIYGRSIRLEFVGDDWPLIENVTKGPGTLLAVGTIKGGYHYNPIPELALLLLYKGFGLQAVAYHVVALVLFWLGASLIVYLAWWLTGRFGVGALAGGLFVAYGAHYEAAIWGAVALWHTSATLLYLTGLILYIRAHRPDLHPTHRNWAYAGFLIALVLGPFAHEQAISLIGACALYRFFVLEQGKGFRHSAIGQRARAWGRDFALPAMLLLCYLGFKTWLGSRTGMPQAPGLRTHWPVAAFRVMSGVLRAFVPWFGSIDPLRMSPISLALWLLCCYGIVRVALFGKPVYRFLAAWTGLLVVTIRPGIGGLGSRHLYLIAVPVAVLWAGLLVDMSARATSTLARMRPDSRVAATLGLVPAMALAVGLATTGMTYALQQQRAWAAGGRHVGDILAEIRQAARTSPAATTIYLIDLPDSDETPSGEPVYLFRNSPEAAVRLTLPHRFQEVIAVRTNELHVYARDYTVFASTRQLANYSSQPSALLLQYDEASGALRRWGASAGAGDPAAPSPARSVPAERSSQEENQLRR